MKKILYILAMAVATTLASCQKDQGAVETPQGNGAVAFSSESIASLTRVSGSEWEDGDAIGIFALSGVSYCSYDNVKYTTAESGAKVSFTAESEVIYHAESGSDVVYMAYYPYQEEWSYLSNNMLFDLSAQDGTLEAQSKVDLLESYAYNNVEGKEVALQFTHSLCKVQITVSNYAVESAFEDLSSLSAHLYTDRTYFDILSGEAQLSDSNNKLTMVESSNTGQAAVFTVIVAPGAVSGDILFTDGENYFTAALSIQSAEAGKIYSFTTVVGDQGYSIVELKSDSVTNWESQTDTAFNSGIEVVDGVYQISSAEQLELFAQLVNAGNTEINGKLLSNIDLEGAEENQWTPIGGESNQYAGKFNGNGFEVSGLYINGSDSSQALFGCTASATIYNLGVDGSVTGDSFLGGLVANASGNTSIINCYNKATVSGSSSVGGLVGSNEGTITSCYNSSAVTGDSCVGGLVGSNEGTLTSCYYNSTLYTGSGVGEGLGDVTGFSTADMQSVRLLYRLNNAVYAYNSTSPTVEAYSWQAASGEYPAFDGQSEATYTIFDIRYESTTYQIFTANGLATFRDLVDGYAQSVSEVVCDNNSSDVSKYFVFGSAQVSLKGTLMNNIDLGGAEAGNWSPIGYYSSSTSNSSYRGTFDGGGFTISGLYIDLSTTSYKGLFGYTSGATIKNLGVSGSISGKEYCGGIVGYSTASTTISACYSNVSIVGAKFIGGIVGWNEATVENCYNLGSVGGTSIIGGVVGYNYSSSYSYYPTVTNCYNVGKVYYNYYYGYTSSSTSRCGVVGSNASGATVTNSYHDSEIDGTTSNVSSGSGDTTNVSVMTTAAMTGGSFAATLGSAFIEDSEGINSGYPILTWQGATE